jgi:hypothetical protein
MKTAKFSMKKLVDYINTNLLGTSNEVLNIYKNQDGSFSHTRDSGWLGGCVQSIVNFRTGDETPKSKAEIKRMIEFNLSQKQ